MNTTSIRNFAVVARERLLKGVDERLNALGFAPDGTVPEEYRPSPVSGGVLFRGAVMSDTSFFPKWAALEADVKKVGRTTVRDEVAYTWFNRFCAIRILAKRQFIPVALEYVGNRDSRTPALVAAMRAGETLPPLLPQERADLEKIRLDDTKTTEQFAILVTAFCRSTPVIAKCFDIKHDPSAADYLSMLLPRDILAPGGFVDALNDAEKISDADYCADELIGWLYQYYISERKQEVFDGFKDGKKAAPEDIPAATQIFTPNWIVKYKVQNSLGRLAIENGLGGSFTDGWQYLIREEDGTHPPCLRVDSPEELTFADVACGSGHILLEGFRHLLQIYIEAGYSKVQAVELILSKNVVGIDLDIRARQLSQFALLLAAMTVDPSFADAHVMPRVLDMEGTLAEGEYLRAEIATVLAVQDDAVITELQAAFALLTQANNLGSIMKFKISANTRGILSVKVAELEAHPDDLARKYLPSFRLILALTDQYAAIVTNPPYMKDDNMNAELKAYVAAEYANGKSDLMTVFMMFCMEHVQEAGRWAMINLPSWMFLSSFENLRRTIVSDEQIVGLLENGRGVFGADFGSVTFVISKQKPYAVGSYRRLFKEHVEVRQLSKIHALFLDPTYGQYKADQKTFVEFPGCLIAYWVSDAVRAVFRSAKLLVNFARPAQGMATADNNRFVRLWFEVSFAKLGLNCSSRDEAKDLGRKWYPYNKGGKFRKWYGNQEYVVNWEHDGQELWAFKPRAVLRNPDTYFLPSISWSKISSGAPAFRSFPNGFLYDVAGTSIFHADTIVRENLIGFLNSRVALNLLNILSPTMNYEVGQIASLPINDILNTKCPIGKGHELIEVSREDWDSSEVSWNFKTLPIVLKGNGSCNGLSLNLAYDELKTEWMSLINKAKQLEKENDELFIEAYGLAHEMSSDVSLDKITLRCNPWFKYDTAVGEKSEGVLLELQRTDTIKELVSYAVGCLMGRYSLDKEGLILASQGETLEDYWQKVGVEKTAATLQPDGDGILPVIVGANAFADDAKNRVTEFVRVVFGAENLNANLNFIEECLGTTLESYLAKEFWKDHKKMYQNRPIYWLFSSKKGAFQCLVYMHRMDAYTATKVRNDYLLKHIEYLRTRIAADAARSADLSAQERRDLKKMQQALDECLEYDGRLHVVADRMQPIDLDDGVVVNYAKFGDVLAKLK